MSSILPFLFDILAFTSVFVIIVLGLGVIASMMGIFNFAHGEFILLGAYSVFFLDRAGVPPWLGMIYAPIFVGIVGLVLERFAVRRFYTTPVAAMLGTYAIGLVIREAVRTALGGQFYNVVAPLDGPIMLGDLSISKWRTVVIVITLLMLLSCWLLFKKTDFGLRVRAALENPMLARASGIAVSRVYSATFAFGAAMAGLAGALMVPLYPLNADMGVTFLIKAFLAVMLGGVGGLQGSVAGSALVGSTSAAFPWIIKPVVADVMVFVLAIVVVKFRPDGLLSKLRS
ncbi:MAG: branched-chain amino acid ABC transporter permease [Betaproteobacteria bacterium]|nr:branched-chain amino acid ABC transporter permease [Betaproteobacteria bacterium]